MYDTEEFLGYIVKTFISCFLLLICFFILMFVLSGFEPREIYHYEYIDLDNNKGIASSCSYKFKAGKAGGQGSPVCILKDGTTLQVKQYKRIVTDTCVPFEDKECWKV